MTKAQGLQNLQWSADSRPKCCLAAGLAIKGWLLAILSEDDRDAGGWDGAKLGDYQGDVVGRHDIICQVEQTCMQPLVTTPLLASRYAIISSKRQADQPCTQCLSTGKHTCRPLEHDNPRHVFQHVCPASLDDAATTDGYFLLVYAPMGALSAQ